MELWTLLLSQAKAINSDCRASCRELGGKPLDLDELHFTQAAHRRSQCSILIGNNDAIDTTDKEPSARFDTALRVLEVRSCVFFGKVAKAWLV